MMLSTVDVILTTDQGYKDAAYALVDARAKLEAAVARGVAARQLSDVEKYREFLAEENALLEQHHLAQVALGQATLAAVDRWIAKRSEP